MKIKKGDKIKLLSGKQKGFESTVEKVYKLKNKILVGSVNIVTRHVKPSGKQAGGIIKSAKPIDVSKVIFICPKCSKPSRLGYQIIDGKKIRICRKCKENVS